VAFEEFQVGQQNGAGPIHCRFHSIVVGIAPRHSDSVDVKFLVEGRPVIVALPHLAIAEYNRSRGVKLTDLDIIQMAGLFLKRLLERGEALREPYISPSREEALDLARAIVNSTAGR